MDLGIKGRRALVCASSKGLGRACAIALAAEGVHITLTARGAEALAKTAAEIRKAYPGIEVNEVAGDITTPEGRAAALKACPNPDILVNNAGGPPPGDFRNWTRDDWIKALDANMAIRIAFQRIVRYLGRELIKGGWSRCSSGNGPFAETKFRLRMYWCAADPRNHVYRAARLASAGCCMR